MNENTLSNSELEEFRTKMSQEEREKLKTPGTDKKILAVMLIRGLQDFIRTKILHKKD